MSEPTPSTIAHTSQEAEILAALGTRLVVLVGMMGAGKSTIGRRLAARLHLPFLDADAEIEAAAGMTIPEIFEIHGEPHFRDGEARVIARLLEGGPAVLATGGGSFMREETRRRVGDKAVSIWLKADADIIMRRVKSRSTGMPISRSPRATCRTKKSSKSASKPCTPGCAARLPRMPPPGSWERCDDRAAETFQRLRHHCRRSTWRARL
jgi:shikimate kinase